MPKPPVPSFMLSLMWHLPYLSIFICPSFSPSPSLHCFPFLFARLFPSSLFHFLPPHMWFCSSSLCTLSLPPSPPPLSSLAHIWFPSLGLCVFGVTQSSVGLPAYMCVCFADGERDGACVCVEEFSRLCNSLICGSFRETSPSWSSIFSHPSLLCLLT